jgi:hypothetical protein
MLALKSRAAFSGKFMLILLLSPDVLGNARYLHGFAPKPEDLWDSARTKLASG